MWRLLKRLMGEHAFGDQRFSKFNALGKIRAEGGNGRAAEENVEG